MRILRLKSLLRATSAGLVLVLAAGPALGQLRPGAAERAKELNAQAQQPNNAAAAAAANPAAQPAAPAAAEAPRVIQHIIVRGTQRVEPGTVLTYVGLREGDNYTPADTDAALKALTVTGLFSDVRTNFDAATGTLTIRVTENPIVNQVVFEGNVKVSDKDLTKEVQIKPRAVFTRAKVQADVQRIVELYRRNGKFAARVDPQIIQRPQNRVDLIFSVTDGPTTGVSRIDLRRQQDLSIPRHAEEPDRHRGKPLVEIPGHQRQLRSRPPAVRPRVPAPLLHQPRLCRLQGPERGGRADGGPHQLLHQLHGGRGQALPLRQDHHRLQDPRTAGRAAAAHGQGHRRRHLFASRCAEGDRHPDQCRRHPGLCLCRGPSASEAQSGQPHHRYRLRDRAGPARLYREDQYFGQHPHP